MTIAPETFEEDALEMLLNSGILLSAGHSNASYEQANTAFGKGRGRATHLFNAMSPFQGRAPGMVGAIYDAAPFASIIADGVHCDFASVRISHKLLGKQAFSYNRCRDGERPGRLSVPVCRRPVRGRRRHPFGFFPHDVASCT
jgi:N-acetylglucosamine-6-phosphate deacetylase